MVNNIILKKFGLCALNFRLWCNWSVSVRGKKKLLQLRLKKKELTLYHNNVNQIAKSLNILGHYSSHDEDSLLEITKKIDELKVLLTEILSQLFDY